LNLPEKDFPEEEKRKDAVLSWLDQHDRWLLILDNVDTDEAAEEVEATLTRLRGGHVLITSRLTQWSASIVGRELEELSLDDGISFLLERTEATREKLPSDAADAAQLAGQLGGLALGLEQAGAYILSQHISFEDYSAKWKAHASSVQTWYNPRLMKYPRSLAVTWETTLDRLAAPDVALLRLFAYFAPDPIPLFVLEGEKAQNVFQQAVSLLPQGMSATGAPYTSQDALVTLANYSMVKWDNQEDVVQVHGVVQQILRTRVPAAETKQWITPWPLMRKVTARSTPPWPYASTTWPNCCRTQTASRKPSP